MFRIPRLSIAKGIYTTTPMFSPRPKDSIPTDGPARGATEGQPHAPDSMRPDAVVARSHCSPLSTQDASRSGGGAVLFQLTGDDESTPLPLAFFSTRFDGPLRGRGSRIQECYMVRGRGVHGGGLVKGHVRGEGVRDDLVGLEYWCALLHAKRCTLPSQCIQKRLTCSSSLVSVV